jgi:hypothetical protein
LVVVLGKIGEHLGGQRLIVAAIANRYTQVVRDNDLWDATIEAQHMFTPLDKVFFLLVVHRFHIRQLTAAQYSCKHFDFPDPTTLVSRKESFSPAKSTKEFITALRSRCNFGCTRFKK